MIYKLRCVLIFKANAKFEFNAHITLLSWLFVFSWGGPFRNFSKCNNVLNVLYKCGLESLFLLPTQLLSKFTKKSHRSCKIVYQVNTILVVLQELGYS